VSEALNGGRGKMLDRAVAAAAKAGGLAHGSPRLSIGALHGRDGCGTHCLISFAVATVVAFLNPIQSQLR
jgi:hypothetical protein